MTRTTRRRAIRAAAGLGLAALAGCQAVRDRALGLGQPSEPSDSAATGSPASTATATPEDTRDEPLAVPAAEISDPPVSMATVPVQPRDESGPTYATFGRETADRTVTLYGSWKCAKTAAYVLGEFQTLLSEYVESGRVAVEFRHVAYTNDGPYLGADAPTAGNAGLAVWQTAPDQYARYFATVFANRPPTHTEWGSSEQFAAFASHAGVENTDPIREAVAADRYEAALERTTDSVYDHDIHGVPRLVVDETVIAPRQEPDAIYELLGDV